MTWRGMSGGWSWTCDWMLIWHGLVGGLEGMLTLKEVYVRNAFCECVCDSLCVCSFSSHSLVTLWSSVIGGGGGCEIIM